MNQRCAVSMLVLLATLSAQGTPLPPIQVDGRVELLSIVFRLAGNPEYRQGRIRAYVRAADAHFSPFRDHAVVRHAKALRRDHGVSFDAVMSLAIHLKDTKGFAEAVPLDGLPRSLERRWPIDEARRFVKELKDFAAVSGFDAFFEAHAELYGLAAQRVRAAVEEEARLGWFEAFFGARPEADFRIAIGLLTGGHNYGPKVLHPDGKETLYAILGASTQDEAGRPVFGEETLPLLVHEFGHSFVNHVVEAQAGHFAAAGRILYPHVASAMQRQAYGNWQTVVNESLVRVGVIRYLKAHGKKRAAAQQARSDQQRSFLWIHDLTRLFDRYEANRQRWPDLESFLPVVAAFFDGYAAALGEKERAQRAPQLVKMVPTNGSQVVDPGLDRIVLTFDREMKDQAWSFVGGGPTFPQVKGKVSYDPARRVLTLPVKLRPGQRYEFWLNRGRHNAFRAVDGTPLESVHVTFRTRDG